MSVASTVPEEVECGQISKGEPASACAHWLFTCRCAGYWQVTHVQSSPTHISTLQATHRSFIIVSLHFFLVLLSHSVTFLTFGSVNFCVFVEHWHQFRIQQPKSFNLIQNIYSVQLCENRYQLSLFLENKNAHWEKIETKQQHFKEKLVRFPFIINIKVMIK